MERAQQKIEPVLVPLRDRVLFLKHNLNAQAISSLKGTEMELGKEIDALIKQARPFLRRDVAE